MAETYITYNIKYNMAIKKLVTLLVCGVKQLKRGTFENVYCTVTHTHIYIYKLLSCVYNPK